MPDSTSPQPRRGGPARRLLRVALVALALVLILIALAPTLISWGVGQGLIRGAVASNINGDVYFNDIGLGWFSGQRLDGVRITDPTGRQVANLSVSLDNSLLSLALGRSKPLTATISGSVAAQLREDGSISLAELFKEDPRRPRKPKAPTNQPGMPLRDAIPAVQVNLAGLNVQLDDLKSGQSLKIDDLRGRLAYVDAQQPITIDLHGRTLTTLAGRTESGAIDITGQADGLFAADGSLTLRGAATKLDVKASGQPLPLQPRPANLQMATVNVVSDDLTERIAMTLKAEGRLEGSAKPTHVALEGSVGKILDGAGRLSMRAATAHFTAEITDLPIDTPASGAGPELRGEMRTLTATIVSEDLTQKIEVAASGAGVVNGDQPSDFNANLALAKPFLPDGKFAFDLTTLTGSASGTRVPTSLAQPMLAGLGVDAQRDLGPTVDVEAFFPGGLAAGGGDLMVEARAAKAQAEVAARMNADGSITGSKLSLNLPGADPSLIAALSKNGVFTDRPLHVQLNLSSFHLPARDTSDQTIALGQFAATGSLAVSGPAGVRMEASQPPVTAEQPATAPATPALLPLERVELNFDSPALAQHLLVKGTAAVGGGTIAIDERITNLVDAQQQLKAVNARLEGSIRLHDLPVETILAFAPSEHADLIRQLVGKTMDAEVMTKPAAAGLQTEVSARTEAISAAISLIGRDDRSLQFDRTIIDATITPALAALLQKGSVQPVVLGGPAMAHVDLKPMLLPLGAIADVLSSPLTGRVTLTDALLESGPGIADSLSIPSLAADVALMRKGDVVTATIDDGVATLKRGRARLDVARVTIDGTLALDLGGGPAQPNLDVRLADLNAIQAEGLLGLESGAIANWTGESGSLDLHVESDAQGYTARAVSGMPNVQGTFTATVRDEKVAITAQTSKLVLGRNALQARLNPPAETTAAPSAAPKAQPMIVVDGDVPMQIAINRCEFPLKMITGESFDPAQVQVDLGLRGGPLRTSSANGVKSTLSDLDLSVRAADISKGVQFALKGTAQAIVPQEEVERNAARPSPASDVGERATGDVRDSKPPAQPQTPEERREARREERRNERNTSRPAEPESPSTPSNPVPQSQPTSQPQPGALDVTGVLVDLVNSEGRLDLAHGRLQMTAKAENVPTAVADALADMQGLLVAAVGPQMNATFVADDFSSNSGTLDAKISTTNGSLEGLLRGREDSFRVNKNAPVKAELEITPPLRERLLEKIHPILADVRSMDHPLRVEIPNALAAIPADVSKLRAEVNITVGKVEFDSGSTTLKILSFFGQQDRSVFPGEIEPIRAQIRNGVVTYDKFSVHIDKYTLNYSGQIDLVKQEVNIRTEIPLKALNQDIPQLRQYAESIVVPLVTRGKFGALKTSIDPDFDLAKAALEAGVKGGLGDLIKGDAGNLLDQILNKGKTPEPDAIANPPADRPRRRDRPTTQPQ